MLGREVRSGGDDQAVGGAGLRVLRPEGQIHVLPAPDRDAVLRVSVVFVTSGLENDERLAALRERTKTIERVAGVRRAVEKYGAEPRIHYLIARISDLESEVERLQALHLDRTKTCHEHIEALQTAETAHDAAHAVILAVKAWGQVPANDEQGVREARLAIWAEMRAYRAAVGDD